MRYFPITLFFILISTYTIFSQEFCGYGMILEQLEERDSLVDDRIQNMHESILHNLRSNSSTYQRSFLTIPVVVHVVWKEEEGNISTERIYEQIQILNQVFNNAHSDLLEVPNEFKGVIGNPSINFCLAVKDPEGNPTSGILRVQTYIEGIGASDSLFFTEQGGSTAWNTEKYLNIWITGHFGLGGYAIPLGTGDLLRDGIVLHHKVVQSGNKDGSELNGRICVHEIGHYLGLKHIWGDDLYATDSLCLNDDGFSDTPKQWRYSYRCPNEFHPPPVSCGNNNMYVNFMDNSPDLCLSMFTLQQVDYMRHVLEVFRPGLNSNNTDCFNFSNKSNELSFLIYPNPTHRTVRISFNDRGSVFAKFEIYNLFGFQVFSYEDLLYDGIQLDLPSLPPAIYIVRIGHKSQKLIVVD